MTKEEFYTKWQPNGFYAHNPVEFMTDLESVIKTEQSLQAAVSGWQELDLVQPSIGQKIVYEGNLFPADGVYVGGDEVRLADGTTDKFDRWKPA